MNERATTEQRGADERDWMMADEKQNDSMRDLLDDLDADGENRPSDPARSARESMRAPLPKRFYIEASVASAEGGYAVHLDGKPVRTPGRNLVLLPTEASARLIADEFAAQDKNIDPVTMPVLRLANTSIDGVAANPKAVMEDIRRFASTDMLCYRADGPDALVARQAKAWDPIVIDWARAKLGARFILAEGVMHVEQPRETSAAVGMHLRQRADPLRLTCLHVMTTLTGSALLAMAVEAGDLDPKTAWKVAHVDEDWNIHQWGEDAEAMARRTGRESEMMAAARLLAALDEGAHSA